MTKKKKNGSKKKRSASDNNGGNDSHVEKKHDEIDRLVQDIEGTTATNDYSNDNKKKSTDETFDQQVKYLTKLSPTLYRVDIGFVPGMRVPAYVIVNDELEELLLDELRSSKSSFLPALKQVSNVAALPGIVKGSFAMPDIHAGYGFCIGNVAAFDMSLPQSVVSPGGVGFDINCGVRLIRTNLKEENVQGQVRETLCQQLFDHIPVGVGQDGVIPLKAFQLDQVLKEGIDWAVREGYAWPQDKLHCEEEGQIAMADPDAVSKRAKKRGLKQLGILGAGNHYVEVQVVEEMYDEEAARVMGLNHVGQICVMIHSGSRGLGHQVATDALVQMESAMARDKIKLNDRQLSCARIQSKEGQEYLRAMSAAANYAWCNRSCLTYLARRAFEKTFNRTAQDMGMDLVYDVCHNVAKVETHVVDGVEKELLVHRKGSTRAFPPGHPLIPKDYQATGQPVLIGGTMGTCSYVLAGTAHGMLRTFGSTCHGAGRALSRSASRRKLDHSQVLGNLEEKGIAIRVASPKLVTEEAPESYKNVMNVVDTCQEAGISRKIAKLRPIAVVKG